MTDDFKCEQCGKCCKSIGLWNVCDNEDWKKIFDYYTNSGEFGIEFKTEGEYKTKGNNTYELCLIQCDDDKDDIILDTLQKVEKYDNGAFWYFDYRCPFLKRTSKGKYKCVLQNIGVKPKICNVYPKNLCNGNKCMRMLNKA